jgi:hypothetical protein
MADIKQSRTYESALRIKADAIQTRPEALPPLEKVTPTRFARLNSRQRRELTLKLIEFLKSI